MIGSTFVAFLQLVEVVHLVAGIIGYSIGGALDSSNTGGKFGSLGALGAFIATGCTGFCLFAVAEILGLLVLGLVKVAIWVWYGDGKLNSSPDAIVPKFDQKSG